MQSVCIKVQKLHGEETIVLVNKLKLGNRELEIQKNEDFIYIPILRCPSEDESETLKQQLANFEISTRTFPEKTRKKASFVDFLEDTLPPSLLASLPHAFDIVGDIAVIEIPPELSAYENAIGEAVLKANKNLQTILSKAGAISGIHRTREYRVLAGQPRTKTVHKEYGCQYHVDLAKAYFSPRLSSEHHRVASLVQEGETVIDFFAGVGPFAVQIAKTHRDIKVFAVDINPSAVELLEKNVRLNRVDGKVFPILGDAREIVRQRFHEVADRVIMNLPEKAMDFIDAACVAAKPTGSVVHFYCFVHMSEGLEDVSFRFVKEAERREKKTDILFTKLVRATAPYEWQAVLDARIY